VGMVSRQQRRHVRICTTGPLTFSPRRAHCSTIHVRAWANQPRRAQGRRKVGMPSLASLYRCSRCVRCVASATSSSASRPYQRPSGRVQGTERVSSSYHKSAR
jgi:hypothetical protein